MDNSTIIIFSAQNNNNYYCYVRFYSFLIIADVCHMLSRSLGALNVDPVLTCSESSIVGLFVLFVLNSGAAL